jgi:hypothetical protein
MEMPTTSHSQKHSVINDSRDTRAGWTCAMTMGEWVVQLIKIALGAAIGIYFIWWSLEVLHRLPLH